ncbi:hypothetical protein [Halalkalicoccus salilacus]|uniref:hypothetical protein n=1 Tax=Halalkalicoccus salilacus TaxID=3117459 RepID=UPI00300ECF59
MNDPERRVRDRLLAAHAGPLAATIERADAVAASWDGPVTRREQVVEPLRAVLERAGLLERYPPMLVDAAEVLCSTLPASPVAAPPYVTVTSRGPVLRATLSEGRLVVRIDVFAVERDPVRYVRRGRRPADVLHVERR